MPRDGTPPKLDDHDQAIVDSFREQLEAARVLMPTAEERETVIRVCAAAGMNPNQVERTTGIPRSQIYREYRHLF